MAVVRALAAIIVVVASASAQPLSISVSNQKAYFWGVNGRLEMFTSTSFQPAEWDYQFFQQTPSAAMPLWKLGSQHIRLQPVSQGVPESADGQWDFSTLDAILIPILGLADHSPELQIATAPSFMDDSQGHLMRAHFQDFAAYCANLVRYYNTGGFDSGGKHYQSPSPYHITWWGIFNEPNGNGISPGDYVDLYNLVVPAMQAADPSIRFVAIELSDFDNAPQDYLPTFVQNLTAHVDVVATHDYGSCNQSDSDQTVLDTINNFADHVHYIYSQLRSSPPLGNVPVWVTENNVNADYDIGNDTSACNGTPFTQDQRGTSAFFAAWRPTLFSRLAKAGAQSLYHWAHAADAQFGEVEFNTDALYRSYWVDYYLAHLFPSPPGADILLTDNPSSGEVESLAVRNDDGSVVVMLVNHQVASPTDNNGSGVTRAVALDVSALGAFNSATQITIDASTDPSKGPTQSALMPVPVMQIPLNGYGVTFLRLSQAQPQFPAAGVVNAASYQGGAVSPGEIVTIFGTAIGPQSLAGPQISSPGFVDNSLAGARIWFDGIPAPLVYASVNQMSAIVPYEVAGEASTQVQIEYLGAFSDPVGVPVTAAVPGVFTINFSGTGPGAILNQDGSLNSAANPAARSSIVSIYATGEGQTNPAGVDGQIAGSVLPAPVTQVSAMVGGLPADVAYAGGAVGIVAGGVQINVQVPQGVTPGPSVPVTIKIGSASSQAGVTLAVN